MSSCCDRDIDAGALHSRQRRVLISVLIINVLTFLMMVSAAMLSGSSSLLSGALDDLGDALTYALSLAVVGAAVTAKAKVALLKGCLISAAAVAVGLQIFWHMLHPETPVFETMGGAALLNLGANALCLALLSRHRHDDVNMSSVWQCSLNDIVEGLAVIAAALAVWAFDSGWPDILVACALLAFFVRSATRVLRGALRGLRPQAA